MPLIPYSDRQIPISLKPVGLCREFQVNQEYIRDHVQKKKKKKRETDDRQTGWAMVSHAFYPSRYGQPDL